MKDVFRSRFKVKNQQIFVIRTKTYDLMIESLNNKPYLIMKKFTNTITLTIVYKNFYYELNDEVGSLIGKLECPIKFVSEMIKYQRFQGNLTEKVAEDLKITFDDGKKAFKLECDLSKI